MLAVFCQLLVALEFYRVVCSNVVLGVEVYFTVWEDFFDEIV